MKTVVTILFVLLFGVAVAQQQKPQPKPDSTVLQIKLTEWQEAQFVAYEKAAKEISERQQYLLKAIIDFNKVKEETIEDLKLQNGYLIIKRKTK